jgi:hypothetical protein
MAMVRALQQQAIYADPVVDDLAADQGARRSSSAARRTAPIIPAAPGASPRRCSAGSCTSFPNVGHNPQFEAPAIAVSAAPALSERRGTSVRLTKARGSALRPVVSLLFLPTSQGDRRAAGRFPRSTPRRAPRKSGRFQRPRPLTFSAANADGAPTTAGRPTAATSSTSATRRSRPSPATTSPQLKACGRAAPRLGTAPSTPASPRRSSMTASPT